MHAWKWFLGTVVEFWDYFYNRPDALPDAQLTLYEAIISPVNISLIHCLLITVYPIRQLITR